MVDKIINNIKLPNGEVYAIGGGGRFGLKGDYSTHYGIEYCQHGLIDNPVGTTNIIVKGGMMLCLPGADTKTTIGSDITYSITSLTDVTIFYADGNILEAGEVHYSLTEPADNGIENCIAWWNPDFGKWQFKSNDTGNVWREAIATPIADIRIEEGSIVRIDYIGYRVLNDDIYGLKNETADIDLSNLTQDGLDVIRRNSAGANMFDTKLLDHILTYEQTKGWALQGTYVYKEAVAGSRYGYPDFYAKCVEEKDLGTPTETVLGENTITLYTNANGHTFYDIADKEAIDAWYNTYGIAWYYGVDTENERIFLPRTKWFIQPTGEITEVNTVNEAGLPNITGKTTINIANFNTSGSSGGSGAIKQTYKANYNWAGNNAFNGTELSIDASRSNPIYGNSTTVQPPSINQLLYICVGNTNVESAVTDVVDVTTTENDTMPLFTGMYFDFTPNNVSWLKAGQQANSGGIYTFTYNELVNILNSETKYGDLKVINVADMETGVDYSEYWKVNQEDMAFITPIRTGERVLVDKKEPTAEDTRWYNLYSDGWCEQGGGVQSISQTPSITYLKEYIDVEVSYTLLVTQAGSNTNALGVVSQTPTGFMWTTQSGDRPAYWQTSGYVAIPTDNTNLYFKVANAVQNLELLDAGEVLESLTDKLDRGNKEEIVSWGIPDYSAGVSITQDTNYTAQYACYIYLLVTSNSSNPNTHVAKNIVINGVTVASPSAHQYNSIPIMVLCPKGATYRIQNVNTGSGSYQAEVYPIKGAK